MWLHIKWWNMRIPSVSSSISCFSASSFEKIVVWWLRFNLPVSSFQIIYSILVSENFLVSHNKKKNVYFLFIGLIHTFDKWQNFTQFVCMLLNYMYIENRMWLLDRSHLNQNHLNLRPSSPNIWRAQVTFEIVKILSRTRKAPNKSKPCFVCIIFSACRKTWLWKIDQQPYIYKCYICSKLWFIGRDIKAITNWQICIKSTFFLVTCLTAANRPQGLKGSPTHCWHFCVQLLQLAALESLFLSLLFPRIRCA